jgi:NitT/TauT family transport system permease protein
MEAANNRVVVEPVPTGGRVEGPRRSFLRGSVRNIALPLGTAVAALCLWQWGVRALGVAPALLPAPTDVFKALVMLFPLLLEHSWQTGSEAVLGLVVASMLGIAVGAALAFSEPFRTAFYPNMVFFQLIPKVALAPLFIMWLGIGMESRLAFTVFITFFPVAISTQTGLTVVDPNYIRFCRGLTASDWQIFTHVRLPFALPSIFTGLKVGVTMAFVGVIVGEFITSQSGLGYLIMFAAARVETAVIFAAITILCLIGLAVYGGVVLLERVAQRFWGVPC